MSKLFDSKNREIKVVDKVRIVEDIPSVDGVLYKDRIVTISEFKDKRIRVKCSLGKVWWVKQQHISASFL